MNKFFTYRIILLSMVLALIIFRFDSMFSSILLVEKFVFLIFNNSSIFDYFSLVEINQMLSMMVLIILIPIIIKHKYFDYKLNFKGLILLPLIFIFLFFPLISELSPNYSKDLSVTKLLAPISIKTFILKKDSENKLNQRVYFDYFEEKEGEVEINQNGKLKTFSKDKLLYKEGKLIVHSQIYLFGTDQLGRDIFTRLMYGGRISLVIALFAAIISICFGSLLGFISGYYGGKLDMLMNRFTDVFLSFPIIYFMILVIALFGNNFTTIIIVLGFSGWMSLYKIVRTEVIKLSQKDFLITSRMIGLSKIKIFSKDILPFILPSVTVHFILQFGNVILTESALNFLGIGTINLPSWGMMIQDGQEYMSHAWWMFLFPSTFLIISMLFTDYFSKYMGRFIDPRLAHDK